MTKQQTFGFTEIHEISNKNIKCDKCDYTAKIMIRRNNDVKYYCKQHSKELWLDMANNE